MAYVYMCLYASSYASSILYPPNPAVENVVKGRICSTFMYIRKLFSPFYYSAGMRRLTWILLLLIPMLGLSCRTADVQREALSDHYWEVQTLRLQASRAASRTQALRDLGVIYLRTGHFEAAHEVLTTAQAASRGDAKLRLYTGLAQELTGNEEAAFTTYQRAPSLSGTSIYSQAMRGRLAWLQEALTRRRLDAMQGQTIPPDSLSETLYAVFPFECEGAAAYTVLGRGVSDLVSHNLDQLQSVEALETSRVQETLAMTGGDNRRVAQLLGAGNIVEGTCTVDAGGQIDVALHYVDLLNDQRESVTGQDQVANIFALEARLVDAFIETLQLWVPGRARRVQVPQSTLPVLMAHSRGLAHEAAGRLGDAAAAYSEALTLDPRFIPADVRYDVVEQKLLAQVTDDDSYIALVEWLEANVALSAMLDARHRTLGRSLDAALVPGLDDRKLPPGNVGELPVPPRPVGN